MKFPIIIKSIPIFLLCLTGKTAGQTEIDQPMKYEAYRVSSYRPDGGNADRVEVPPESSFTVAEIEGSGRIVHMWFTIASQEPEYLKTTRIRIYWDQKENPAVDVPFGDFHALGHGLIRQVDSSLITVVARPHLNHNLPNKNVGGFNSYFPMPFHKRASIDVCHEGSGGPLILYFYIDYEVHEELPEGLGTFHAQWRR